MCFFLICYLIFFYTDLSSWWLKSMRSIVQTSSLCQISCCQLRNKSPKAKSDVYFIGSAYFTLSSVSPHPACAREWVCGIHMVKVNSKAVRDGPNSQSIAFKHVPFISAAWTYVWNAVGAVLIHSVIPRHAERYIPCKVFSIFLAMVLCHTSKF